MNIIKSPVVEKFVNPKDHCMADTCYGTEGSGTKPQVCFFPEELQAVTFGLQGVNIRIGNTQNLNAFRL